MSGNKTPGIDEAEYRRLLAGFPPRPIHSAEEAEAVQAQIDELIDKVQLTPSEELYLDLLGTLLHAWEEEQLPIQAVSGIEAIRLLLEEHDLPASSLADIFGTRSIVSEVLAGKRRLQARHIEALAERFQVSPAIFFPTTARQAA